MVNRTYADLARHYRTAIVPARPYRPRDKAKVEVGVQIVGRWILARLRNRRFFSLAALNEAIRALLIDLNDRPLRSWGRTRRDLFDELDRPALTPLPDEPYEYAEWKRCRVNLDYHVEIAKHYYSVPYNLVHQEVEARITPRTVEIFLRGKRVASHLRSTLPHRPTTVAEHMPSSHRRYRDWTHDRIRREAAKVGPDTDTLIDVILRARPHPEQGFRSAIGILGLVKRYGRERVDSACARALLLNARSYKSVAAILKNGTDKTPPPAQEEAPDSRHKDKAITAEISNSAGAFSGSAQTSVMNAASLEEPFTFDKQDQYKPVTKEIKVDGNKVNCSSSPHSFTQIKVKVD